MQKRFGGIYDKGDKDNVPKRCDGHLWAPGRTSYISVVKGQQKEENQRWTRGEAKTQTKN